LKILITGANSFIGKHYIHKSRYNGIQEISLIDKNLKDIDFKEFDVIIHLAAIVHRKEKVPENEYFKINRDLAIDTAKQALQSGIKHFIFMSTLSVYGDNRLCAQTYNEFSECLPTNAYGKSKLEAETGLQKMNSNEFCVSIIRTPLVIGEGVMANMHSLISLVDKIPILPFASVSNKRSYTSIENLIEFIDLIIHKRKSGIFIASDEDPLSTTELVKMISKSLGKKLFLFKLPTIIVRIGSFLKPGISSRVFGSFVVDNSLTVKSLDYKQVISTEESINKMVNHYKKFKN
jgi:UDP-glucose 4-epimerase